MSLAFIFNDTLNYNTSYELKQAVLPDPMVESSGPRSRNELPHCRHTKAPQQAQLRRGGIDEVNSPLRADQVVPNI